MRQKFRPNAQVAFENVRKRLKTFENIRKVGQNIRKYLKIFEFFAGACAFGRAGRIAVSVERTAYRETGKQERKFKNQNAKSKITNQNSKIRRGLGDVWSNDFTLNQDRQLLKWCGEIGSF